MKFVLQPWQLFVVILASWIHRPQQEVIEYLRTENAVLKEKLGSRDYSYLRMDITQHISAKGLTAILPKTHCARPLQYPRSFGQLQRCLNNPG
jgi:hypothetical protein